MTHEYIYIYIYIFAALIVPLMVSSHAAWANSSGNAEITAQINSIALDVTIPDNSVLLNLDSTASLETADLSAYVTTTAPYGYTLLMTG